MPQRPAWRTANPGPLSTATAIRALARLRNSLQCPLCAEMQRCSAGRARASRRPTLSGQVLPRVLNLRFFQPHANIVRVAVSDQERHIDQVLAQRLAACLPAAGPSRLTAGADNSTRTPRECNRPTSIVAVEDVCYRCKDSKAATSCKGLTLRRVRSENEPAWAITRM